MHTHTRLAPCRHFVLSPSSPSAVPRWVRQWPNTLAALLCASIGVALTGCDPKVSLDDPPIGHPPGDIPPTEPPGDDPPPDDPGSDNPAVVTAITPPHASASGGTLVQLSTSGFSDDFTLAVPGVMFAGTAATSVIALDATTLAVEVPAVSAGDTALEVAGSVYTAATTFEVLTAIQAGEVIVNEALANPGGLDASRDGSQTNVGDEFVELVNLRDTPVDLSGFALSDAAAVRHVFANPTTLPAGGALAVFGAFDATLAAPPFAAAHASGQAHSASSGSLSLNNGGDTVTLIDPLATVIDSVDFGASTAAVSLNRDPDGDPSGVPTDHTAIAGSVADATTAGDVSPALQVDQTVW